MSKPFATPVVIVGEVEAGAAAKARAQLEALISAANKSNFDIAETCYLIKSKGYYHPYTTFKEFSETLQLKPRKVQYLTRMAGVFDQVGVKREVYEALGIARCREITSLDPDAKWTNPETNQETPVADYIKLFVEKGEDIEMDDLKQHVRTIKGFIGESDLVWANLCFTRLVRDTVWTPALEKAKAMIGSVKKDDEGTSKDAGDARAAEIIAANFLSDETFALAELTPEPEESEEVTDEIAL